MRDGGPASFLWGGFLFWMQLLSKVVPAEALAPMAAVTPQRERGVEANSGPEAEGKVGG